MHTRHIVFRFMNFVFLMMLIMACSKDSGDENILIIENEEGEEVSIDTSANKRNVGDSSNDLLSSQAFTSLTLEILYMDGMQPEASSLDNMVVFLNSRINKPGGVQVIQRMIDIPSQEIYSISDIRQIEDDNRLEYNMENTIAVSGIFIDGEYDQNTSGGSVLGVAYRNTSFVIFEETIQSFANQPLGPSLATLESVVMNHEIGHLLGLVNAGTTMQADHQDTANGRHCTSDTCLMFWSAETGEGLLDLLTGGSVPELDALCLDDLQANGGK